MSLGFTEFIAVHPSLSEKAMNLFTEKGTAPAKLGSSAARGSVWPGALKQALPPTPLCPVFSSRRQVTRPICCVGSLSVGKIIITWFTREG